jgi:hypothetical protein
MKRVIVLVAALSALAVGETEAQQRGGATPQGGYRDSCRDIMSFSLGDDSMLVAQCRDQRGRWRGASLRVGRCRDVSNEDGDLICRDGGQGGPGGPGGGFPGGPGGSGRPPFGGGSATLFSGVDFGGQAFSTREEVTNLPRQYNDRAMSLRVEGGAWTVCADSDFAGRCETFDRDVRDLRQFGLGEAISSLRRAR